MLDTIWKPVAAGIAAAAVSNVTRVFTLAGQPGSNQGTELPVAEGEQAVACWRR